MFQIMECWCRIILLDLWSRDSSNVLTGARAHVRALCWWRPAALNADRPPAAAAGTHRAGRSSVGRAPRAGRAWRGADHSRSHIDERVYELGIRKIGQMS